MECKVNYKEFLHKYWKPLCSIDCLVTTSILCVLYDWLEINDHWILIVVWLFFMYGNYRSWKIKFGN